MSEKNFMSYGDAESVLSTYAADIKQVESGLSDVEESLKKSDFVDKTWSGSDISNLDGINIWSNGPGIFYSNGSIQKKLNVNTSEWSNASFYGMTSFDGKYIWTDGEKFYYSNGSTQKVLSTAVAAGGNWSDKTWTGMTSFSGEDVWTDGTNIYYSNGSTQKVLDKTTSTWSDMTWGGTPPESVNCIWTDGSHIYYSLSFNQRVLDKTTNTWSNKTWTDGTNEINPNGYEIWTDGYNIYWGRLLSMVYSNWILDKATSIWSPVTFSCDIKRGGERIWSDGTHTYYSESETQKEFVSESVIDLLDERVATLETSVSTLSTSVSAKQNKTLTNSLVIAGSTVTTVEGALGALNTVTTKLSFYLETTATLSTSADTTVTFTNNKITASSLVDIAVSEWGLVPDDVTVSAGSCAVTFPSVDSAHTVTVRLYVR